MKRTPVFPILAAAVALSLSLPGAPASASGEIRKACLKAGRAAASRSLCGCIQDVAEEAFNRSERRKIAKFFADPHATQDLRQSDRSSDERFWQRYKAFGQSARAACN